jgi:hypothetical protein
MKKEILNFQSFLLLKIHLFKIVFSQAGSPDKVLFTLEAVTYSCSHLPTLVIINSVPRCELGFLPHFEFLVFTLLWLEFNPRKEIQTGIRHVTYAEVAVASSIMYTFAKGC